MLLLLGRYSFDEDDLKSKTPMKGCCMREDSYRQVYPHLVVLGWSWVAKQSEGPNKYLYD